jgi:hypothetical protein
MQNEPKATASIQPAYEPPELFVIGDAHDVVLGIPGSGYDGPMGFSEPGFEFECDGED